MIPNYRFLFLFLILILYVSVFHLFFLLVVLAFGPGFLLNAIWLSSFYFGICIIAFLAMRADRIRVTLFSRVNIFYSLPVLFSLIIGEIVIFSLVGECQSVDTMTIMFLPLAIFSEEYLFRGYFQNIIGRIHRWYVSLIFTNIMFALLHVPSEIVNGKSFGEIAAFLPSRFISGFSFSVMYLISENLLIPVLIHGFDDLTLYYFPTIQAMPISTIKITLFFFIWAILFSITFLLYRSRLKKQVKTN